MTSTPTDERPADEREAEPVDATTPITASSVPPAPEPAPFWQRPLVERFLVPVVLPVAVIVGLVAYVLNISRIFLSGHGHIPVIVGSVVTVLILLGATLLAAGSDKLRRSAVTLVAAGFILSIMSAGWLVVGSAQPKETGPTALPDTLKTNQTLTVTAGPSGRLAFAPGVLTAKTGLAKINVSVAAPSHTFNLADPTTLFPGMSLNSGAVQPALVFFEKPGTYTFFCATTGHEAGGMKGTITVTGPPITLEKALADAGNPPGAVPGA